MPVAQCRSHSAGRTVPVGQCRSDSAGRTVPVGQCRTGALRMITERSYSFPHNGVLFASSRASRPPPAVSGALRPAVCSISQSARQAKHSQAKDATSFRGTTLAVSNGNQNHFLSRGSGRRPGRYPDDAPGSFPVAAAAAQSAARRGRRPRPALAARPCPAGAAAHRHRRKLCRRFMPGGRPRCARGGSNQAPAQPPDEYCRYRERRTGHHQASLPATAGSRRRSAPGSRRSRPVPAAPGARCPGCCARGPGRQRERRDAAVLNQRHRLAAQLVLPLRRRARRPAADRPRSPCGRAGQHDLDTRGQSGAGPATRRASRARCQSKIGSRVRLRLSSKKPSVPATSSTPSHSFAAASPRGIGEITGPKNETPSTEMTGVPTS